MCSSDLGARVVAAGVCYCCKTGVVASGDDVLAVWRHVYPGNLRDIAFAASRDRGRTFAAPVRVSEDHWMIDGCPENGPTVTVAGAAVHVIWPTVVAGSGAGEPTMALFHAVTTDHRTFCSRNRVPTEGATPKHPRATTLTDGRVAVVWDEGVSGRRQVVLGRKGRRPGDVFDRTVLPDYDFAQYPAVAALPEGGLVVAWASGVAERTVVHVARMGR